METVVISSDSDENELQIQPQSIVTCPKIDEKLLGFKVASSSSGDLESLGRQHLSAISASLQRTLVASHIDNAGQSSSFNTQTCRKRRDPRDIDVFEVDLGSPEAKKPVFNEEIVGSKEQDVINLDTDTVHASLENLQAKDHEISIIIPENTTQTTLPSRSESSVVQIHYIDTLEEAEQLETRSPILDSPERKLIYCKDKEAKIKVNSVDPSQQLPSEIARAADVAKCCETNDEIVIHSSDTLESCAADQLSSSSDNPKNITLDENVESAEDRLNINPDNSKSKTEDSNDILFEITAVPRTVDKTANDESKVQVTAVYKGVSDEDDFIAEAETVDIVAPDPKITDTELPQSDPCPGILGFDRSRLDSFSPTELAHSTKEFMPLDGNFLKGCKWSPDGTCLLAASNDNIMRLYNLPTSLYSETNNQVDNCSEQMVPALRVKEGETIYDFDWYPEMSSAEAASCCFVSTSRDHPVHLWDAYDGQLRCSYRAYNHLVSRLQAAEYVLYVCEGQDEIVAANSVCFSSDGKKVLCGFNKTLRIFTTVRPGRDCTEVSLCSKGRKKVTQQRGIISAIACSAEHGGLYALGSFMKSVGVYSEDDNAALFVATAHVGGVTHLKFSPDGYFLYSGGRKDAHIHCWDLRAPGHILFTVPRIVATNQRIQFDVTSDGSHLITGDTDGHVRVFDVRQSVACEDFTNIPQPRLTYDEKLHKDAVNGVSLNPTLPLLATSSGQRHFCLPDFIAEDKEHGLLKRDDDSIENCVKVWRYA